MCARRWKSSIAPTSSTRARCCAKAAPRRSSATKASGAFTWAKGLACKPFFIMALTQRLDLRQSQTLVMTPQLQQAIKLLELNNLELTSYVEGELEQNPFLEREDDGLV